MALWNRWYTHSFSHHHANPRTLRLTLKATHNSTARSNRRANERAALGTTTARRRKNKCGRRKKKFSRSEFLLLGIKPVLVYGEQQLTEEEATGGFMVTVEREATTETVYRDSRSKKL